MTPVRIFFLVNEIILDGWPESLVAGSLSASTDGTNVTITNNGNGYALRVLPWQVISDSTGAAGVFASVDAVMAYLQQQFSLRRSLPYQEQLAVTEQNVLPPLTKAFVAGPGAFANIIVGAATMVDGAGAVQFTDGSNAVTFDPEAAGFNLNPGDLVVAQYSTN